MIDLIRTELSATRPFRSYADAMPEDDLRDDLGMPKGFSAYHCAYCGEKFLARLAIRKRGQAKFCSRTCKGIASRRPGPPCSVDGCERSSKARGLCNPHWLRWNRYGNPVAGAPARGFTIRFINEVAIPFAGDECLLWPYGKNAFGYGLTGKKGGSSLAHVRVCAAAHGEKPSHRHEAAHNCGVPACCNPKHLRWATPSENASDKRYHGTSNAGENHCSCKLRDADVAKIRELGGDMPQCEIAKLYGVSPSYISRILNGRARALPTDLANLLGASHIDLPDSVVTRWRTVGDIVQSVEMRSVA